MGEQVAAGLQIKTNPFGYYINILVLPVIRAFKVLRFLMTDKTVKCTLKTSYREIIDEIFFKE